MQSIWKQYILWYFQNHTTFSKAKKQSKTKQCLIWKQYTFWHLQSQWIFKKAETIKTKNSVSLTTQNQSLLVFALLLQKTAGIRVIRHRHTQGKILLTVIMFSVLEFGVKIRIWQFSQNFRGYLKNHWANRWLVCTHLNTLFMFNPSVAMKIYC